jgi:hypothetical protein
MGAKNTGEAFRPQHLTEQREQADDRAAQQKAPQKIHPPAGYQRRSDLRLSGLSSLRA